MKVFISWSGERTGELAQAFRAWLPQVLQAIEPWLASHDIAKGARWHRELEQQLDSTSAAIICVSKDNLASPWIAFEAGALSREIERAHVCPYLIDISPAELPEPLRQFQVTLAEKEDTRKLLHSLNRILKRRAIKDSVLDNVFEAKWPELQQVILSIRSSITRDSVALNEIMSFGTRDDEPVELVLDRVKSELMISGNDCKKLVEAKAGDINKLLDRGVRVRVVCVDPNSSAASMLAQVDPRFSTPSDFVQSMASVRRVLRSFSKRYPSRFEYRLLPILPAFGLFITDPESDAGMVRVELYTSKPWSPVPLRPRLLLPHFSEEWRSYFQAQWTNYWSLARADA